MASEIIHERFWCPRDGTQVFGDDGYLVDPATSWGKAANPDLVAFDAIADTPCLVLLGEPGAGKTTSLRRANAERKAVAPDDLTLFRDLGSYQTDVRLEQSVFRHPTLGQWRSGSSALHLCLDSLDESIVRIEAIAHLLLEQFGESPLERLVLRIACRTTEWPSELEKGLARLFGEGCVKVYEIAPLRRVDVARSAEAAGVDPNEFLAAIQAKGAMPFAARPITLTLLLNLFRQQRALPGSQAELYLRGCRLLCEEPATDRRASRLRGLVNADERLAVAARIAAVTMYCGTPAIWTGLDLGDVPERDVALRDLWGGEESVGDRSAVEVDTDLLDETLGTGLFASRGPGRLGWSHQTYAEFLAAQYVVWHAMTLPQIMSLLISADDQDGRLIPQLHGTAGWIASMRRDVFQAISIADPEVLLPSDLASLDDAQREFLVGQLLEKYDSGRIIDRPDRNYRWFVKLRHPGLAEQLRPYLLDATRNGAARSVAVQIVGVCEVVSVQGDLVQIALDETIDDHLRIWAAYAVGDVTESSVKARLKPLAIGEVAGDADLELKGCALQAVWPDHLSAGELFASLVPPPPGLIGIYSRFFHSDPLRFLAPGDLPTALQWATDQVASDRVPSAFDGLIDVIIMRGIASIDQPQILTAVATLILERLKRTGNVLSNVRDPNRTETFGDNDCRHTIIRRMVELLPDPDDPFDLLDATPRLITREDFGWVIEQFAASPASLRHTWLQLAERIFTPVEASHGNLLLLVTKTDDELRDAFRYWVQPVNWPSDDADRHQARHEEMQRIWEKPKEERQLLEPAPAERVKRVLALLERGQPELWESLTRELTLRPDSTHYNDIWRISILDAPGWVDASTNTRERILDGAVAFLQSVDPEAETWLGSDSIPYSALAGMKAFHLLYTEDPQRLDEISADRWGAWCPVILRLADFGHGEEGETLTLLPCVAYARNGAAMIDAVIWQMERDNAADVSTAVLARLAECWDGELQRSVLEWALARELAPRTLRSVGTHLLQHSSPEIEENLKAQLALPVPPDPPRRERAIVAAWALLSHAQDAGWSVAWPAIESDVAFGREVMTQLAGRASGIPVATLADRLGEHSLADLYLWLFAHFPRDVAWPRGEMGEITPEHNVDQFRTSVLQALARKGTCAACSEIERIMVALPNEPWLRRVLDDASRYARIAGWQPPGPREILELARSREVRLVQTGDQLLEVLEESLRRLQDELHGETPAVRFIWDKWTGASYRPVDENTFSDFVKIHLDRDLRARGVIINREVQIHRSERTDIHVDAVSRGANVGVFDTISAIIEVKGSWHDEVFTAMQAQLVERYLADNRCDHGLYLVGWFTSDSWDRRDRRRRKTERHDLDLAGVRKRLEKQASGLSREYRSVRSFVVDAELR
jgi:hypothetical protein